MSDFDTWTWDDAPVAGEVTNESFIEQGFNKATGMLGELLDLRTQWFAATNTPRDDALTTVEHTSQPQANSETASTIAGMPTKYILGGLVVLGLALYAKS